MIDGSVIITSTDANAIKYLMQPTLETAINLGTARLIFAISGLILIIGFICFLSSIFEERKSTKYTKVITDMYVAGAVRKFAKEDGIVIEEEFKEFKKWEKKRKMSEKELDSAIEENLKDKVSEKTELEIAKLNKSSGKAE